MLSFSKIGFLLAFIPFLSFAQNQSTESLIQSRLTENVRVLGLQDSDIEDWVIYDEYVSKLSSVKHVYIRQRFEGIEIYNGVANFNIKDGKVLNAGYRLVTDVSGSVNTTMPTISQAEAINYAANHLGISQIGNIKELKKLDDHNFLFTGGELSVEEIPVKLMYMPMSDEEKSVRLVWDLSIYIKSQDHWWSMRIDAVTGEMLDKLDWVVECNFDNCTDGGHLHSSRREIASSSFPQFPAPAPAPPPATDAYRVFAIPAESPTHGPRTLVVGPSDALASPFGWHDDNGVSGPEYLHTQGNNVRATEDRNDNNGVGVLPNGGVGLSFDFPLDLTQAPIVNENAAITNLFYMNNIMHDIWYHYGFDEVSGNFQENSYGNGGVASDMVYAEAQDGGGMNNANFATPADGGNPRMQMYLWTSGVQYPLTINSPAGIAGQYQGISAGFGPGLPAIPLTADLALVDDGTGDVLDACSPLINGATVSGKIAVILRGTCGFTNKVQAAQDAGAVGVIVVNNVAGAPFAMGGASATITIPSIMVSDLDGALIIAQLQAPVVVNGSIVDPGPAADNDGDYDNGIIAHEYGHGISNRLTGGPSAANCLGNAEQMGEGWSDWFGLMLTIEPGDLPTDVRGIGTYAIGEPTNGGGIRPAPYSTDLAVNNYTYGATNNTGAISQPHGIGFVWCTMLWDLTWAMVNQHGYDTDLYNGTGGNNMTMALVIEGLKLQTCNPGFVDGRDAILAADQALYAGANQCLIWEVFAARGLGFSADQGSSNSRTDQTEAYDLPLSCQPPTVAPNADFSFSSDCSGMTQFTDLSNQIPQSWSWDFGDGNTDTLQYPSHTYGASGTYTVVLIAGNIFGADTVSYSVTIIMPSLPVVSDENICANQSAVLSGTASGSIIWYDVTGTIPLDTAVTYTTPVLATTTTYQAENVEFGPIQYAGPVNASFGGSGYHNQGSEYTLNFTAYQGFTILSVWVDAGSTGNRTINIWDEVSAGGTIIASTTVNITSTGPQRIPINLVVPSAGDYSIGGIGMNLRRNNSGVSYPYILSGVVDITSSSVGGNYYYYYYDWEVQTLPCRSGLVSVQAIVNPVDSTYETISTCTSYTWPANSMTYSSSGTYTSSFTNAFGCDSIATLYLTIGGAATGGESVATCSGYTWSANGTSYTNSGIYSATLTAVGGCDSIATLNLTINNPTTGSESATACGSYTWSANTSTYSSSGIYTAVLTNAAGCDSTATLNLTIINPSSASESASACDTYTWAANSSTYSSSGTYSTTLTNASGCDSVVTLNLVISSSTTGSESVSVCDSFLWLANGNLYTSSGVYTTTLANSEGCDSIATLNLNIGGAGSTETLTACDSYIWPLNGQVYSTGGTYTETLTTAGGCDSVVTLFLTIETIDASATQSGPTLFANQSGVTYQWLDCVSGLELSGETGQTYTAVSNGSYAVIVSNNSCIDTSSCMEVTGLGIDDLNLLSGITYYPNPTTGKFTVDLDDFASALDVRLTDVMGKHVKSLEFAHVNNFDVTIEGAPGVYFLRVTSSDGKSITIRIAKK